MSNKTLTLVPIASEIILYNIKMAGYSIRRLGKETSYSERSIRAYLQREEMPEKLVHEIDDILRPKKHPIRICFDVTVTLSDEELNDMMIESRDLSCFTDIELDGSWAETLWNLKGEVQFHKAHIDKCELEQYADWFNKK